MKSSQPAFAAAAAPGVFSKLWSLVHKLCVTSMLFMAFGGATSLLGATKAFAAHIGSGLAAAPDALTNISAMILPPDGGASFAVAPHDMAHSHMATESASSCPINGAPFEDYKQVFDCGTPDYRASMLESAQATRRPLEEVVAGMCSSGTVVTHKVWDYAPS